MTANEKRQKVVESALTRKGKNLYSQDTNKRNMIETGFGDCSATIRHWYKKILGIDIGVNTEAQIKSKLGKIVDMEIKNGIPDESKMKLGDCLFYRGSNDGRYLGVGHIEMYIGNGQLFGHGSGMGGTVKNIKNYCATRQNTKSTKKLKNRGLIYVVRFIEDDPVVEPKKEEIKVTTTPPKVTYRTYKVVKGDSLSKISLKLLGNANRYKEIMELNGLKNTVININQVLKIPLK